MKFIDVDKISEEDSRLLISLSKELVDNSMRENVEKITEVISKYTSSDMKTISRAYEHIKKKRLEAS